MSSAAMCRNTYELELTSMNACRALYRDILGNSVSTLLSCVP